MVPGTFGGGSISVPNALKQAPDVADDNRSIGGSNSNSFYNKPSMKEAGPSMSITGSDGMLSFNPSNLNKIPGTNAHSNSSISGKQGEAPPMSFGGTMLNNVIENEAS